MEAIYLILGLAMFYAGIHAVAIVFKKIKDTTEYESIVLWVAFISWALYIISTLSY